jgi:hypothetical protein
VLWVCEGILANEVQQFKCYVVKHIKASSGLGLGITWAPWVEPKERVGRCCEDICSRVWGCKRLTLGLGWSASSADVADTCGKVFGCRRGSNGRECRQYD